MNPNIGFTFSHEHEAAEFWGRDIKQIKELVKIYFERIRELE